MKSRSKAVKQTAKNEGTQPSRPIDMVPQTPQRHTIRVEKAHNGGYAIKHEVSHGENYTEKLHVARDKNHAKEIINKII